MKMISLYIVSAVLICSCASGGTKVSNEPKPAFSDADYGSLPVSYKEMIEARLKYELFDPYSAHIEWLNPMKSPTKINGTWLPTYSVGLLINAKNRLGGYTGSKLMFVQFYKGQIVQTLGPN